MTISSTVNRTSTDGDGSAVNFSFPYLFFNQDDLTVILVDETTNVETTQTITTHYTVTGAGVAAGGTVIMGTAPTTNQKLVILREEQYTQTLDLVENDPFPSDLVEQQLDTLTMLAQQLKTLSDRSVKLSDGDFSGADPTLSTPIANAYILWDSAGTALTSSSTSAGQYLGGNGTVSLPFYSHSADPDSGWFRVGANNIAAAVGGSKVVDVTSTGINSTVIGASTAAAGSFAALTASSIIISGDLTISGDDLTMGTNTSGAALIADGTNFNPVVISGDISINTSGVAAIGSGVIVVGDMAANSVDSAQYVDGSIDTAHLGNLQVTTGKIAADAIDGTKLADDAVDSEHYTDGSVDTAHLAADVITGAKIADDAVDSEHYTDGSIDTAHLGNLQVTTAKIAADAIDGTKLADNAVDSEHYTDGSIDTAHLAADVITGAKLADDAIDSEHYTDGSIDTAHLAADVITGAKIADDAIDSEHYTDGSIDTAHLAADVITGAKIADDAIDSEHYVDGSIDNAHIADDAIDSEHYVAGSIDTAHYAAGSVDATALGADAVTAAKIGDNVINSEHYAAGSIDLEHMSSESVDEDNLHISNSPTNGYMLTAQSGDTGGLTWAAASTTLGNDSVDSQHYVDGSIDTAHLGNLQVTTAKIAADAIDGTKLADDAVDSEHYTDGSIDNAHIADDAIDSEHYVDGSIDTAHLAADVITGAKIADDAIDSEHYTDGSIDNAHIADDAIDSEHYAAGSIDTAHIADDQITLAKMASGTDGNIISYDASGNPVAIATGSDGQVLTSAGAGQPPAFEAAGGGGGGSWNLIGTVVASDSATLTLTGLDSTYDTFAIAISDLKVSVDTWLIGMRFGDSSGIDSGSSDYAFHANSFRANAASTNYEVATSAAYIRLQQDQTGAATGEGFGGMWFLNRPGDGAMAPSLSGQWTGHSDAGVHFHGTSGGGRNAVITLDRIDIYPSTGGYGDTEFTSGRMTVWGIAHA